MDKSLMLEQLRTAKKIKTKKQFAELLGISTQNLNNWHKRNVYDTDTLLAAFPDLNPQWVLTGEGDMFITTPHTQGNTVQTGDIHGNGNTIAGGDVVAPDPNAPSWLPSPVRPADDVEVVSAEEVPYISKAVIESRELDLKSYIESGHAKTIIPQGLVQQGVDYARKIYSDAMAPDIREGDIVLCSFVPDLSNLVDGDIYALDTTKYGCVIRDIKHDGDEIILIARNHKYPDLRVKQSEILNVAIPMQLIRSTFSQRTDYSKIIRDRDERIDLLVNREFDHIRHTDRLLEQLDKASARQDKLIEMLERK